MLGEQGFPGLAMFLLLHLTGLVRMSAIRRRYRKSKDEGEAWVAPLATALQSSQLIYLVGGAFVGIAFLPFIFMILAVEIGFDGYLAARRRAASWRPLVEQLPGATPATA
jgi:hypothetical protein